MRKIDQYLGTIYNDFRNNVDSQESLCNLEVLNYAGCSLPDYNDICRQQLYMLRYIYAYAYEYSYMYSQVLQLLGNIDRVNVTSFGCGSMVDFWGLEKALSDLHMACQVDYTGVDKVRWQYLMCQDTRLDQPTLVLGNVENHIMGSRTFASDIYFFPKSISEFSDNVINIFCQQFATKQIEKDRIFMCFSLRKNEINRVRDINKVQKITNAVKQNGFDVVSGDTVYWHVEEENKYKITSLSPDFVYPELIETYVSSLHDRCHLNPVCSSISCHTHLNRRPVTTNSQVCYQIVELRRKAA